MLFRLINLKNYKVKLLNTLILTRYIMSFSSINYNNNNNNNNVISCIDELTIPAKTIDPFLFCVYHKDIYPAGDKKMYAPRRGNGHDFDSSKSYRMYHGDRIPGFPQHPHRGFETVTATLEGLVDHTDSLGNGGRYGQGDLQWMTAGRGVVHGEMFALVNDKEPNPTRLFQIWLNLPRKSKMVPPAFAMHWHENIPKIIAEDGKTTLTLWAGTFGDQIGLPPPPDSYGTDPNSELGIYFLQIPPGGSIDIPPTKSAETKRMAYFVEGSSVLINNVEYTHHCIFTLKSTELVTFQNSNSSDKLTEILILQGKPLNEPVAQHGPFVMNTRAEIQQAFEDYRTTGFGGWPWPEDAMVFPRDKGRFALMNGKEERPQSLTRTNQDEL